MGGCSARQAVAVRHVIRRYSSSELTTNTSDRKNLESYYLFWLDNTAQAPEFMEVHDELRAIINYVKIFESDTQFLKELEKIKSGKIFLIASVIQCLPLLSRIHGNEHLYSIYIYSNSSNLGRNQIADQFNKVRGLYDSFSTAKRYLEDDVKIHTDLDDPMVMSIDYNDEHDSDDLGYREKFDLFLKIVNTKANNIYDSQTRDSLIKAYEEYYKGNEVETHFIKKFSQSYKAEDAMTWFMGGSCLHRLLNRAFNERDMCVLADLYSFIVDLNRTIKSKSQNQTSTLKVYRAQFMSNEDFSMFQEYVNKFITMQCFFGAQTSREAVLNLLLNIEPIDKNFKRIVFEIEASHDFTLVDNIESSASKTALFVLGSVFKITSVSETTIILSQSTSTINTLYDLANESPVIIEGILIYLKHGPFQATHYFQSILSNLPETDHATISSVYGQLASLEQQSENPTNAAALYEQLMTSGTIQFGVYLFYLDQAAKYYSDVLRDLEKANTIWLQKLNIQNALNIEEGKAQTYENLARIAFKMKQNAKIVEYASAAIERLPHNHPHLPSLRKQLEYAKNNLSTPTTT